MSRVRYTEQSARLEHGPSYMDALRTLEAAGRTCYASEAKGDPEGFVRRIIGRGHGAVLEHISVTMALVVSRGVQNEIVRHRTGTAFCVQSTRYCDYRKDRFGRGITCIVPPDLSEEQRTVFDEAMQTAGDACFRMLDTGAPPETARDVLPLALATPMTVTMNIREWRYFLNLRLDEAAHPMMRQICRKILHILADRYPVLFEDIAERYAKDR